MHYTTKAKEHYSVSVSPSARQEAPNPLSQTLTDDVWSPAHAQCESEPRM